MGATPSPSAPEDLEAALTAAEQAPASGGCKLGIYYASLPEGTGKDKLKAVLAVHPRQGISNPRLSAVLTEQSGENITTYIVSNHRRGLCHCKAAHLV